MRPLVVGIHTSRSRWAPEVEYVVRTLMRIAGYPHSVVWLGPGSDAAAVDVYYGPPREGLSATIAVNSDGPEYDQASRIDPVTVARENGVPVPVFGALGAGPEGRLAFSSDLLFACYWLLTGARESSYPRGRTGNLDIKDSVLVRDNLLLQPPVSLAAAAMRRVLSDAGHEPVPAPWLGPGRDMAFAFTHDVDYPLIMPWLESARLLLRHGPRILPIALAILRGTSHYWTFQEWVTMEREFGARPTFFFMARQGSLLQYALGTPDDFYDIRTEPFRRLIAELLDAGSEIGLHASFNAYRDVEVLRAERERVAAVTGRPVYGNRHHYWHLDPDAPNDTLRLHEQAGFLYDCSLAFEYYPGFRRGICHPFRVFHPGERRELEAVQLPTAWMDDHFDRRRQVNGIADPETPARALLDVTRATGGAIVVDYHSRGMNADVYPRYGPWITRFARAHLDARVSFPLPYQIAQAYQEHARHLDERSAVAPV